MQCTFAAGGVSLSISIILAVMLLATMAGAGWHLGRWLIWFATHSIGQQS